jgi:hypothetical protein
MDLKASEETCKQWEEVRDWIEGHLDHIKFWRGKEQEAHDLGKENASLSTQLSTAIRERDALVAELVSLFDWDDKSWLHAILHVNSAVLNLRADLAVATQRAEKEKLQSRLAALEKVVEVARDSIHDCSCKNGVTYEYVDGMPVAEIPCPYCWGLRAALDALKEGG